MNIKPQTGKRNYAKGGSVKKGYLAGGTIWPDASSPYAESLPISGGSANLPGGTIQTGGPGVYDPQHPERGAQGWSTFYEPATVPGLSSAEADAVLQLPESTMGGTVFAHPNTVKFKYKP
jgi:hypothetical protein